MNPFFLPYKSSFQSSLQTPPTIRDQQNENLATYHLVDDPVGFEVDLSIGLDTQQSQFGEKMSSLRVLIDTWFTHRRIWGKTQMPWNECKPMDERLRFMARFLEDEKMAPLCREFGLHTRIWLSFSVPPASIKR